MAGATPTPSFKTVSPFPATSHLRDMADCTVSFQGPPFSRPQRSSAARPLAWPYIATVLLGDFMQFDAADHILSTATAFVLSNACLELLYASLPDRLKG